MEQIAVHPKFTMEGKAKVLNDFSDVYRAGLNYLHGKSRQIKLK